MVVVLPDGVTLVYMVDFVPNIAFGSAANLAGLTPMFPSLDLSGPYDVAFPAFFSYTWSGAEPPGAYTVFLVMTQPGSLADNVLDPTDVVAIAATSFTFTP